MEGIEKITAKIVQDAEQEVRRIREEAEEQSRAVLEQARVQAQQEAGAILTRGRRAADERLERLNSAAGMERRKLELSARQEVLGEAFDLALEQLCSLPEEKYVKLLTDLVLEASSTGREQLIFSPRDRAQVGKQVVVAANEALASQAAPELPDGLTDSKVGAFLGKVVNTTAAMVAGTGMLTLSQETRDIRGGFILVDGDVEVNCAFETMLALEREKLERQAAERLFER